MAKKSMIAKAKRAPKFCVRAASTAATAAVARARYYRQFGLCRICLRETGQPRRASRRPQGQLVGLTHVGGGRLREARRPRVAREPRGGASRTIGGTDMSMTDPIADMLTRVRNANSAFKTSVTMPSSQEARRDRPHPEGGGLHRGLRGDRGEPQATLEITLKYGRARSSARSPASAASASPACACTRRRTSCRAFSAASASPSSPRRRAS